MALTRLAQRVVVRIPGLEPFTMRPRALYDCNPPPKSHWTHRVFVEGRDPDTKKPLATPEDYVCFQMNPVHNAENLPPGYIEQTLMGLSARMRRRFLDGEFADATPNALFREEDIDKWRVIDGQLPEMVRIVVAVDPSGSGDEDNVENDEIGIVVDGLGVDGNAYVLEDCTVKAGPKTWGNVATTAYDRHEANLVVGEVNFGGAMVKMVVQTARPNTPFKAVTASRGKHVRAEPFSALYEQGKVRHAGYFPKLEDELTAMSTIGYTGSGSPNRADAHIWALAELFQGIVQPKKKSEPNFPEFVPSDPALGMLS
jgi:predicted phage terminase large subunit-like protein